MANNPKKNDYFNGNKGKVWINGIPAITITKGKAIRKIKYEEVSIPGKDTSARVKVGETIEVSLTLKLLGDEDFDAFNESEDISVIIVNENISGKILKRLKLDGVTFDEESLVDFEKGKVGEVELSGQAQSYEWLQK